MIRSFKIPNLRGFHLKGDRYKIGADMAKRIGRLLDLLEAVELPEHTNMPGNSFHKISGADRYSVHLTETGALHSNGTAAKPFVSI